MKRIAFQDKYGPWALVIGAAEGLGASYVRELATNGFNIVMLDIKFKDLRDLSKEIKEEHDVSTIELHIDIRDSIFIDEIRSTLEKVDCRFLVYNAAISFIKPFILHTQNELHDLLEINIKKQLQVVHLFSQYLIKNNTNGGILIMSSLAGLIGTQLVIPYAASKAFAWNLAEALSFELKEYNIDVMAVIAGAISTPTYLKTNPSYGLIKPKVMSAETVVVNSLNKIGKKVLYIPGFSNRLNYFILLKLLPRNIASRIVNKTMAKMYAHKK